MGFYLHDIRVVNGNSSGDRSAFPDRSFVQIFAIDETGSTVFVEVKKFKTWMYVEYDSPQSLKTAISGEFSFKSARMTIVERIRFVGFSDDKPNDYLMIEFLGQVARFCGRKFLRLKDGGLDSSTRIKNHESSVDPRLKSFHQTKVRPSISRPLFISSPG